MQDVVKTNVRRKQNTKRTRRRRRNMSLYFLLVVVLVVGIGVALSMTLFFNINTVVVQGDSGYTDEQIVEVSGIHTGDNLVRLDTFAVRERLLTGLLNVEDASIHKAYPSSVEITLRPCVPSANIAYDGGTLLVSAKGKILDTNAKVTDALLQIYGFEPATPTLGTYLKSIDETKDKIFTTICAEISAKGYEKIISVDMTDKYNIMVNFENRIYFYLGNSNEISYKLELATAAMSETNADKTYEMRMVGSNQISVTQKQLVPQTSQTQQPVGSDVPLTTTAPVGSVVYQSTQTTAVSAE